MRFIFTAAPILSLSLLCACPGETPADAGDDNPPDAGSLDAGPPADAGDNEDAGLDGTDAGALPPATRDEDRDILFTDLAVDVTARTGQARITVAASPSLGATFDVGDLTIESVMLGTELLNFARDGALLDVGVPDTAIDPTITIDYAYDIHDAFDGALASGVTLTWPHHCGNLFPCNTDPADGAGFSIALSGIPDGEVAVYPAEVTADAPAYQVAWAVGDYTEYDLGETTAGTRVYAWSLPGNEAATQSGTASLVGYMDWYEQMFGPYPFGDEVGSVDADWGPGGLGGMEHHPFWHVGSGSMGSADVHAHEAAHGWFGDGVRIACWEDFVLSEGTVAYLTARAIEAIDGQPDADALWADYEQRLGFAQLTAMEKVAWPDGCGEIEILDYFSNIPYMKGAFFYRALEYAIGRDDLDTAIATAYERHGLGAARMQDMLDIVEEVSGFDPTACATEWLKSETVPSSTDAACTE